MEHNKPLRIGVSMRVAEASGYNEPRDALAHDWAGFMKAALPDALWMPLPNLGAETVAFAKQWQLDAFILTGGNDIGTAPIRDISERAVLDHAVATGAKALGICRGLQLMTTAFGGQLTTDGTGAHVAKDHAIRVGNNPIGVPSSEARVVNSYHDNLVVDAGDLTAFAYDSDGNVEAAYSAHHSIAAIMWHPEREETPNPDDIHLFRQFFEETQ